MICSRACPTTFNDGQLRKWLYLAVSLVGLNALIVRIPCFRSSKLARKEESQVGLEVPHEYRSSKVMIAHWSIAREKCFSELAMSLAWWVNSTYVYRPLFLLFPNGYLNVTSCEMQCLRMNVSYVLTSDDPLCHWNDKNLLINSNYLGRRKLSDMFEHFLESTKFVVIRYVWRCNYKLYRCNLCYG